MHKRMICVCKHSGKLQQGPPGCQGLSEGCALPLGSNSLCSPSHGPCCCPLALSPLEQTLCVRSLAAEGHPLALSNPKVQGRSCGALHVRAFSAVTRPSFLDYLRNGAEISFMVAVVSLKGGVRGGEGVRDTGGAGGGGRCASWSPLLRVFKGRRYRYSGCGLLWWM